MMVPRLLLTCCLGLLALAVSVCAQEAQISAEVVDRGEPTYLLYPDWKPGKRYHWLQRFEAAANVAGIGKQTLEWRQHFHLIPSADAGWEIGCDQVRMDLDVTGDRSRYYFDPSIPLRFQDRRGIQGTLLQHAEQLVRHRYRLSKAKDGRYQVRLLSKARGKQSPAEAKPAWSQIPWKSLTQALLHQGFPPEPVAIDHKWTMADTLIFPKHGQANWELVGSFTGFKEHKGKKLALVKLRGSLESTLHEDETLPESPGVAIKLSKVRGLTLVDIDQRQIVSSAIKLDGKLHSLGLPGTAEGETAPFKSTLTLSLKAPAKKEP